MLPGVAGRLRRAHQRNIFVVHDAVIGEVRFVERERGLGDGVDVAPVEMIVARGDEDEMLAGRLVEIVEQRLVDFRGTVRPV
jgi:hypothetical protein